MRWKELPIDPRYLVSPIGDIKGLDGRILRQASDSKGYKFVTLSKDKVQFHLSIHRAVALTYIPNPLNLPQVNHIDENKTNNFIDNLEWCTNKYNCDHSNSIKVLMIDKDTNEVLKEFNAMRDVDEYFQKQAHQSVSKCCNNVAGYKTAYGYKWRFK